MPAALALAAGVAVAAAAWRARALTGSGAAAAAAVGTAVLLGTGWSGGAALLTFFIGSTAVSRLCPDPAATRGDAKGGRRDALQVLANGGLPALAALYGLHDPVLGLWALTGGLAAAAGDTWATAIGGTAPRGPRHLLTGRPIPAGTSGGVTIRGTLGGVAGAASVAAIGATAGGWPLFGWITAAGVAGMMFDSLLGALVQGRFHCPACDTPTERPVHRCGAAARPTGGLTWITNDTVNLLATFAGAIAGLAAGIGAGRWTS